MSTCEFRSVDKTGRVVCDKVEGGNNEVSPALCQDCPFKRAECEHLRFTLHKTAPAPIVVRYATGRVEVWNNDPPSVRFQRAACALKACPVQSPEQCFACPSRTCRVAAPQPAAVGRVVSFPRPVAVAS
jgi:hypothetical protein